MEEGKGRGGGLGGEGRRRGRGGGGEEGRRGAGRQQHWVRGRAPGSSSWQQQQWHHGLVRGAKGCRGGRWVGERCGEGEGAIK